MKTQWPLPAYWADFEDLCYHIALASGELASAQKYGRRGQRQFGVDIAGTTAGSRTEWIGIQCKLHTENLGSGLTVSELHAEYKKSTCFQPSLTRWILATTSPRDRSLQDAINALNASFQRKHAVDVWFWEDVSDLLEKHSEVARRFYQFPTPALSAAASCSDSISAFLFPNWEATNSQLNSFLRNARLISATGHLHAAISTMVLEAVDNCLHADKGKATRVVVEFDGTQLRIKDNGVTFDPLNSEHSLGPDQFGLRAIRAIASSPEVSMSYEEKDVDEGVTMNCLSVLLNTVRSSAPPCSAYIDVEELFNRSDAFEAVNRLAIPADCDPYVLRLVGHNAISVSGTHQFILQLKQRLGARKLVVVVGSHRKHVFEHLVNGSSFRDQFEVLQE
jgi:hypothetical protein